MRRAALAITMVLAVVAGCAGDDDVTVVDADEARVSTTAVVATQDAAVIDDFRLPHLTVEPGVDVTISNLDDTAHTFTAAGGSFDTGALERGREATFTTPTEPGVYRVMCTIHPTMEADLTVV